MKKSKQIAWINYARCAAVFSIVLCHAAEELYGAAMKGEKVFGPYRWTGFTILFLLGRLGVPVFLGLTGTLMLGKQTDAPAFYRRTLLPLIVSSEIWIVVEYFQAWSIRGDAFSFRDLIRQVLFIDAGAFGYLWYIPMIIGVYLVLPFLSRVTQNMTSPKEMRLILSLSFLYFLVLPEVNEFILYFTGQESYLSLQLEMKFWGGVYGLYLILGYFIGKHELLDGMSDRMLLISWGAVFVLNFLAQFILNQFGARRSTQVVQYNMVGIFLAGMLTFEGLRRLFRDRKTTSVWVRFISSASFGIYLIHRPIQIILNRHVIPKQLNPLVRSLMMFVISMALSIGIIYFVSRISKKAAKILFYYRT